MSYILDALRKADAQRERDPARGIHAQPIRVAVGERRPRGGYGIWFWTATAAGLAALASVGWYFYRDGVAQPVAPPVRTEVVAAAPAPAVAAPPAVLAAAPADAVLPPPAAAAPPRVSVPGEATAAMAAAKGKESSGGSRAGAATATPSPARAVSATAAASAVADAAAPVAGLPADAPKLAISGGVYSANAAQRMLIVNGQVFNEGGEIGPGLVLEEIRPKAALLRFRGSRYTVAY